MADRLSKPLTGQYRFILEADRVATLTNLGLSAVEAANSVLLYDEAGGADEKYVRLKMDGGTLYIEQVDDDLGGTETLAYFDISAGAFTIPQSVVVSNGGNLDVSEGDITCAGLIEGNTLQAVGDITTQAQVNAESVLATGSVSGDNVTAVDTVTGATVTATSLLNAANAELTGDVNVGGELTAAGLGVSGNVNADTFNSQKVYKANLTQSTVSTTSGLLVVGKTYRINTLEVGDDFANVGYVSDGVNFVASGTTPTSWANSTEVTNVTDSAPVATVIENSLSGPIVWSWAQAGQYTGTLAGAFLVNKVWSPDGVAANGFSGANPGHCFSLKRASDNTVTLLTADVDGIAADGVMNTSLEIVVAP